MFLIVILLVIVGLILILFGWWIGEFFFVGELMVEVSLEFLCEIEDNLCIVNCVLLLLSEF